MNIWIVTVGEPLPTGDKRQRLLRSGQLCQMLAERGHQVTWWTSTFNHWLKEHTFPDDRVLELGPNATLRFLHGRGYTGNVSLSRLIDHHQIARKFRMHARAIARPDIILCSFPTIELSTEAVRYGQEMDIPVVLDIRDLWPDVFIHVAPKAARPLARLLLWPYFKAAKSALKNARALCAINDGFLNWGIERAERTTSEFDRAFPMGYPSTEPSSVEQQAAREFWDGLGVSESDGTFKAIFVGTIGRQFQFEPVLEAARTLASSNIRFIVCGTGDLLEGLRRSARDLPNVILPGWVGAAEIWSLMRMSQVGLAPYHDEESFTHSLPNKALEYLSASLPIVSSLPGTLARLLAENCCGITYPNLDASALRAALETIRNQPGLRREMAQNAQAIFNANFRAEAVYDQMISHLERLLRATSRSSLSNPVSSQPR